MSRLLDDADGFNGDGEPTGEEPSGVWAEIIPYGGAGASQDAERFGTVASRVGAESFSFVALPAILVCQ